MSTPSVICRIVGKHEGIVVDELTPEHFAFVLVERLGPLLHASAESYRMGRPDEAREQLMSAIRGQMTMLVWLVAQTASASDARKIARGLVADLALVIALAAKKLAGRGLMTEREARLVDRAILRMNASLR